MTEEIPVLLAGPATASGERIDVLVEGGVIRSIRPAPRGGTQPDGGCDVRVERVALDGYVLLPAPVEPHAHLDKALLARRVPNTTFDLSGAITAVKAAYPSMTAVDIEERATRAALISLVHGCMTIRSHADCNAEIGLRAVEGLIRTREKLKGVLDLQVVALAGRPISGLRGAENRQALKAAMAAGADIVGGAPQLDEDPAGAIREFLAVARDAETGIDLHIDETTDPRATTLMMLARAVAASDVPGPVTASHCVSLGSQDFRYATTVARAVAEAGISVISLPQTNLYLQGRKALTKIPRGLTALNLLRNAGVVVAAGGDNVRDPFNPMGSADPLETGMLLVAAGHLTPDDAYAAISTQAHRALGLTPSGVEVGAPANLLAVRGESLTDVLASRTQDRFVMRSGRPLTRSRVEVEWFGDPSTWRGNAALVR